MTRKEFLKVCGLLGISLPFGPVLTACQNDANTPDPFTGSVLIIGAGAAGMASAYLLAQKGIDFRILEASSIYGGRIKQTTSFTDFPISLGGEWLHVSKEELKKIVNNPSVHIHTTLQAYKANDQIGHYEDGELTFLPLARGYGKNFIDQKFINSSWLDFFEAYILPSIESHITFDTPITAINYQGEKVLATDHNGQTYEAEKLIFTPSLKILQAGDISFAPSLPNKKLTAIQEAQVWGGFKAFIAFSEKFYPTFITFADSETKLGQRLYYDAAYGQQTSEHILGLFAVGQQAEPYQQLSGIAQKDYILSELDQIFDSKASQTYTKHITQNWNEEPFIKAAYLADVAPSKISRMLSHSIDAKIYFAGEAYTKEDDWGAVHNAVRSARDAVKELLS